MYVEMQDTKLWVEVSGTGNPIILLHGNGESHEIFQVLVESLRADFTVYAVDSRGHGKSEKSDVIGYQVLTNDVAALIQQLGLEKPMLYGFSDGGIVGLMVASQYPELLMKLAISGANTCPEGVKPFWRLIFRILYLFTRSPKINMMLQEPNITTGDLSRIQIPVLVLAGEKDLILESDTRFIAENIPQAQLRILPKENHMSYVIRSPKLARILIPFLREDTCNDSEKIK